MDLGCVCVCGGHGGGGSLLLILHRSVNVNHLAMQGVI